MIASDRNPPYRESTEKSEKQQGPTLGLCSQYTGQFFVPICKPIRYSVNTYPICDGAVSLCYRIPTRYAFRASAKAIYPVVNMAFVFVLKKRPLGENK